MKKGFKILLHFSYWFYKFVWGTIMGGLLTNGKLQDLAYYFEPLAVSLFIICPVIFYFNYFFIMPRYYQNGKMGKAWISWILLLLGFAGIRYLVEEVLFKYWLNITNYSSDTTAIYYVYDNLYIGGPLIIMSVLFWVLDDNMKKQKEKYVLLEEKKSAQLSFLKNQVNPHFIFNTLNNIYSLVSSGSKKALTSIEKLSELMRYMYKDSEQAKVSLAEELGYINSYVDLQRIRLSDPAIINYQTPVNTGHHEIAPLLLIPFIENMFKHGNINSAEKPLQIKIEIKENKLCMTTCNYISNGVKDEASGVGLPNVRKRLELLYPGNYSLEEIIKDGQYFNNLVINLDAKITEQ